MVLVIIMSHSLLASRLRVMRVELDNLGGGDGPRVGESEGHGQLVRLPAACRREPQRAVGEGGEGEAMPKAEERRGAAGSKVAVPAIGPPCYC